MMIKFVVREQSGAEKEYNTVQEAFTVGQGKVQSVEALPRFIVYPVVLVRDTELDGRLYGPVLRP